jgi:hypothetical protein
MTINLFGGQAVFGLGDETIDDDAEQLDIPLPSRDRTRALASKGAFAGLK